MEKIYLIINRWDNTVIKIDISKNEQKHSVDYDINKITKAIQGIDPENINIMHTHPGHSIPSFADLNVMETLRNVISFKNFIVQSETDLRDRTILS